MVSVPIPLVQKRINGGAVNDLKRGITLRNGRRDLISQPVAKWRSQTLWANKIKNDHFPGPFLNKGRDIVCQVLNSGL